MTPWFDRVPRDAHWLIVGGTRRGKSGLLQLMTRAIIARGLDGLTAIDPHGAFVRDIAEWLANPGNGQCDRDVVLLDPSSSTTFGLNCLETPDTSWESCHLAASTLTAIIESRFEAPPEQTPRLARVVYIAAMFCARRRLTLIELVEMLSLGGDELRRALLCEFDNDVVRRELEDLHALAQRQPARFLEVVESVKNRFVRWLGDPRLARILGQRTGLSPRKIMDGRQIVLADFSSLNYQDAAFLGCILTSMYFATARYRPPLRAARHRLILDEAESLLTADVARMCDQSAKAGLNLIAAIQRLGQLRARGDFLADALMTNCALKVVFGGLEPASSRYMAEALHAGFVDLAEWKPGTERPVAVGAHRELARSAAIARHAATHAADSESESVAFGASRTRMRSVTEAEGESVGDVASNAQATASMTSDTSAFATSSFDGMSMNTALEPFSGGVFMPPTITGLSVGESAGRGATAASSRSSGASSTAISGSSRAVSRNRISAVSEGFATTESETRAFSRGRMRGESRGTSETSGLSECFVTTYAWMPTATYSLEEQLHRLAGELANLERRQCYVKIEDQRPFRTRTLDLAPAFRSARFKRQMLPLWRRAIVARCPFLLPVADAERAIAARTHKSRPTSPGPDFTIPEPACLLDDPRGFARDVHAQPRPSVGIRAGTPPCDEDGA